MSDIQKKVNVPLVVDLTFISIFTVLTLTICIIECLGSKGIVDAKVREQVKYPIVYTLCAIILLRFFTLFFKKTREYLCHAPGIYITLVYVFMACVVLFILRNTYHLNFLYPG